jgi:signal-transduction protein with cAMP-binding, CBS, and nucleotidyltransferase domain
MTAESLISSTIIPLRTSDTGEEALGIMNDFYVRHLPIVNDNQLFGVISEDDILENNTEDPIGSYVLSLPPVIVKNDDHVYEVMRMLAQYDLTIVPIVDHDNNYVGLVSQEDLLHYFARIGSFAENGTILVIEVNKRDYSLAEIARIVESEGASILSTFLNNDIHSSQLQITLKINSQYVQNIIATLTRFKYVVKASFNENDYLETLQERYDSLMSYLNV